MIWQYRIFRHDNGDVELVEAIYEGDQLTGWTLAFSLRGESIEELREMIEQWLPAALGKPVLDRTSFKMDHCCDEHAPAQNAPDVPQTRCEKCEGSGNVVFGNTAHDRGIGGQIVTGGTCPACHGTGSTPSVQEGTR